MKRVTAIDSIRGILLAWMAIDHWGGPMSAQLYERLGFWTAAEGFFLISGYVATQVALEKPDPRAWFLQRSRVVWKWHLLALAPMAVLALALPAFGWRPLPGLEAAQWLRELAGAAALVHQPDYLDVLPLYVVLLLGTGLLVPGLALRWPRRAPACVFAVSLLLWLAGQFGATGSIRALLLPGWMRMGLFDPLGWQLLFFVGVSLALLRRQGEVIGGAIWRATVQLALLLAVAFFCWRNGVFGLEPLADESVWISRARLGPLRVMSFGAAAVVVVEIIRRWPRALDWAPARFLGQHSLAVFSLHLPLIYVWHFRPQPYPWLAQVLVPLLMLGWLFLVAWVHARATSVPAAAHAGPVRRAHVS